MNKPTAPNINSPANKPIEVKYFFILRHLNKLRMLVLSIVFFMLLAIPTLGLYQNFVAAHAYDLLTSEQKALYDTVEFVTDPFLDRPEKDLDAIKGTTWSARFFSYKISDPLAVVSQSAASLSVYWPFLLTALIPILATLIFGRFFCGWICPATFLYELNSNLRLLLHKLGFHTANKKFDKRIKYGVLVTGLVLSAVNGTVIASAIYPPAIIGREAYYAIALGGFGSGAIFFLLTLLFDLFVSKRGFCRYLCPGGALYSLLGRFRLLRIQRVVENCNDCAKCNAVCEFGLDPLHDNFGQECNNCTACIAVCPVEAMTFAITIKDAAPKGHGHQSKRFKKENSAPGVS